LTHFFLLDFGVFFSDAFFSGEAMGGVALLIGEDDGACHDGSVVMIGGVALEVDLECGLTGVENLETDDDEVEEADDEVEEADELGLTGNNEDAAELELLSLGSFT